MRATEEPTLKKLLAACAATLALTSAHAIQKTATIGPWDGIFECAVQGLAPLYVTLNGRWDGVTVFTIAAAYEDQPIWGFGFGQVQDGKFTGKTNKNGNFSMSETQFGFKGPIEVDIEGKLYSIVVDCSRLF